MLFFANKILHLGKTSQIAWFPKTSHFKFSLKTADKPIFITKSVVQTQKKLIASMLENQIKSSNDMNKLLDTCLFLLYSNHMPEISYQQHQTILLSFSQIIEKESATFFLFQKFIKYAQGYNLSNRINSTFLLKKLMRTKLYALNEQKNLPEILNFFTESNAPKNDLIRLLDIVIPIYDQNLAEIDDSTLISLFYHVVYLNWKYDKKPTIEIKENSNENQKQANDNQTIVLTEQNQKNLKENIPNLNENVGENKINCSEIIKNDNADFAFFKALEEELILRLGNMSIINIKEFSRIIALKTIKNYVNNELFKQYQKILIKNLKNMLEPDVIYIVNNLRFCKDFSKEFCENFEVFMLNKINSYKSANLFIILRFVRNFGFQARSALVYQILLTINKNCMKSIAHKVYSGIEQYGQKRENMSFLIENLMYFAAQQIEQDYIFKYSFFPLEIVNIFSTKIFDYNEAESLKKEILNQLSQVTHKNDFIKLTFIINKLNINDGGILDRIFSIFKIFTENQQLFLSDYCDVLGNLLELNYYIDFTKETEFISNFLSLIHQKTRVHKVFDNYMLLKILANYIRIATSLNQEILKDLQKAFVHVADNSIKRNDFFVYLERIELLRYLVLTESTCYQPLIDHLLKFFSPKNSFFRKELDYIPRNDHLERLIKRVTTFYPSAKLHPLLVQTIQKTKDYFLKETQSTQPIYFQSNFAEQVKSELVQYFALAGISHHMSIQEGVQEHTFEFDLKLQNKKDLIVFVDFHGKDAHGHVNHKEIPHAWTLAKGEFLRKYVGVEYVEFWEEEWVSGNKKEIVKEKMKKYISE